MAVNIQQIIQQLQAAQDKANAANLARYNSGLAELQKGQQAVTGLYGTANANLANIGATATEDINRQAVANQASGYQDLVSRGLGNTTITSSVGRGVESDRQKALRDVNNQQANAASNLAMQQAGQTFGMSGSIADFMAQRADVGPDAGLYASLISQAANNPNGAVMQTPGALNNYQSDLRKALGGGTNVGNPGMPTFGQTSGGGGGAAASGVQVYQGTGKSPSISDQILAGNTDFTNLSAPKPASAPAAKTASAAPAGARWVDNQMGLGGYYVDANGKMIPGQTSFRNFI